MTYSPPGKEVYTKIVEIETHAIGSTVQKEVRGSSIPDFVHSLLIVVPSAGKAVLRDVTFFDGSLEPSLSLGAGGGRSPVSLKTVRPSAGGALMVVKPERKDSIRLRNTAAAKAFGLY